MAPGDPKSTIETSSLSFLQIGDVHLPEFRDKRMADVKDSGFPQELIEKIAPTRLQEVIRSIITLIESRPETKPNALLISGDLSSKGVLTEYQKCVEYLHTSMRLGESSFWNHDQIHVVPGNHDVDRAAISAGEPVLQKFEPLQKVWESYGLPILTYDAPRHTSVISGGGSADIFSLNSCLGCGAAEYLPAKIRAQLSAILNPEDFQLKGIQLDTPAFDSSALATITSDIESLTSTTLPIVLSHHNILPQAEPRVELYTEAINSGLVRSQLSQLKRPVLYCHGHLHKDPVEIITSPESKQGRLICISAPLLSDGFNLITVQFARSKMPLGCIIRRFRLHDDCKVRELEPVRVPLWGTRDQIRIATEEVDLVSSCINNTSLRFRQLKEQVCLSDGSTMEEIALMDILLELEWAGSISIHNKAQASRHWQISRNEA